MNRFKKFGCIALIFIMVCSFAGCRNNLANNWDEYSGNTEIYTDLQSSDTLTFEEAVSQLKKEDANFSIPDYWESEIQTAITNTKNCIGAATGEHTSFLWYTDAHWSYGSQMSVSILRILEKCTPINRTNFGGDVVSTYNIEANENKAMLEEWRQSSLKLSNHHSVVGNHDDDVEWLRFRQDLYDFLIAPELEETQENNFCYFIDDEVQKTRYVYLGTGLEETTKEDLEFLVEALSTTKEDWHIVALSHIWFDYEDSSTPTVGSAPDFVTSIFSILDAYNARTSGTQNNIEFDFCDGKAKVEFCIGGHTHVDYEFATTGGIPVVLTETDSFHLRGEDKTKSETNGASVSAIVADYEKGEINIIRAGRGEDWAVQLNPNN